MHTVGQMPGQIDEMFTALANRFRRRVLFELLEHDPQTSIVVPEAIHRGEIDRDTLFATMYHIYLPKLDEMGFIEWDRTAHTATRGPRFREIQSFLQLVVEHKEELPVGCQCKC